MEEINSYDYSDLMAQLNPQMVEDDKGNITGITSASLSSVPLAKQAGLKDNDVIQAVNGITIDSQEKIGEIATKVGNANTIRLSVLREGKPQMITVKVQ
jgi:S1-C subfamily serine protease